MKFYYYNVYNLDGVEIGKATSANLLYYNTTVNRMLGCDETLAQYIVIDDIIYRPGVFANECKEIEGHHPEVIIELTTEEDYQKYRNSL